MQWAAERYITGQSHENRDRLLNAKQNIGIISPISQALVNTKVDEMEGI